MDLVEQMAEHIGHRVTLMGGEDASDGLMCETCGEYLVEWEDAGSSTTDQGAASPSPERIEAVISAARAQRRSDLADSEIVWIAAAITAHLGGQ
jgi:hypothetical protein